MSKQARNPQISRNGFKGQRIKGAPPVPASQLTKPEKKDKQT